MPSEIEPADLPEVELTSNFLSLSHNAQRLLLALSRRLVLGQSRYGDFPDRQWTQEAAEEALDLAVYLAATLVIDDTTPA